MKLHLPTLGDLLRLFFTPTDVSAIVAGVNRQVAHLRAAVEHHDAKSDLHAALADDLRDEAKWQDARSAEHAVQATRAQRVAGKLASLVA